MSYRSTLLIAAILTLSACALPAQPLSFPLSPHAHLPAADIDAETQGVDAPNGGSLSAGSHATPAAPIVVSREPVRIVDSTCSGAAAEDTVRIINNGSTPLTLSSLAVGPAARFSLMPPVPNGPIAPGTSVVVRIRYTPAARGITPGTLSVTSTDPSRPSFNVALLGISDSVPIEKNTNLLVFRSLLSCQFTADTSVLLINRWTDTAVIPTIFVDAPFAVLLPPPIRIAPGDTFRLGLRFAPTNNGTFTGSMRFLIGPCGKMDSVVLRAERVMATYNVTDVAFGDVTVGGTGNANAAVTNSGTHGMRIASATIVPATPGLSIPPAQFPIRVPSGGNANVAVQFAPTAVGTIPAGTRLQITIDSLCTETVEVNVSGRGIPGGVSLDKNQLAFGSLQYCRTGDDTVTVTNVSAIPVTLGAPVGGGGAFSIAGGTFTAGTLAPSASVTIIARFAPGPGPNAVLRDTIRITSSDPLRPLIEIPLSGSRVNAAINYTPLSFVGVPAGTVATTTATVTNSGGAPIFIDALTLATPFTIIGTTPPLPAVLQPGEALAINVEFAPPLPGTYRDTIRVAQHSACDSLALALSGTAIDPVLRAEAFWDDVSGAPGDIVRIPLRLNIDLAGAGITSYEAGLRFNPTLLLPLSIVVNGTLSAGWNVNMQRPAPGEVRFTATGTAPLAGTGVLAFVEARVMLGDSVATFIAGGDSLVLATDRAIVSVQPGLFTLSGYCTVGGARLLHVDGARPGLKAVRPNPVGSGAAEVELATVEQGHTSLVLYDAMGRHAGTLLEGPLAPGTYIVTLQAGALPAGVYYLELRTPHDRDRMRVMIRR